MLTLQLLFRASSMLSNLLRQSRQRYTLPSPDSAGISNMAGFGHWLHFIPSLLLPRAAEGYAATFGQARSESLLMRGHVPFVEAFGAERVVTRKVPCDVELLLLLAGAAGEGLDRTALGRASKYSPPRVSEAIRRLSDNRYVHQTRDARYHITGPGEQFLAEQVASLGETVGPLVRRR